MATTDSGAPAWSPLERFGEGAYFRDHLDGAPVHCGAWLELQAVDHVAEESGVRAVRLPTGVLVRYELAWRGGNRAPTVMLHGSLGGHPVAFPAQEWHRFRWPRG